MIGRGVDYDSGPYSVMIPAGLTTASLNIAITDYSILEKIESFDLFINTSLLPSQVNADPDKATVTIMDDDGKTNL